MGTKLETSHGEGYPVKIVGLLIRVQQYTTELVLKQEVQ